jgi:hypothetical protein
MNTKRLFGIAGVLAAAVVIGYFAGRQTLIGVSASSNIQVRPYVMETTDSVTSGGQEHVTAHDVVSRRRDGAVDDSSTVYGAQGPEVTVRREEFPGGLNVVIYDSLHAKSTTVQPSGTVDAQQSWLVNSPPQCATPGETVDGTDKLFGNRAVRILRQQPDRLSRILFWRLPGFNCVTVQLLAQKRAAASGAWETVQEKRLTGFSETDPNPSLFSNWVGYQEMKPSDVKAAYLRSRGVTPQQCKSCFAAGGPEDRAYAKWHRQ